MNGLVGGFQKNSSRHWFLVAGDVLKNDVKNNSKLLFGCWRKSEIVVNIYETIIAIMSFFTGLLLGKWEEEMLNE